MKTKRAILGLGLIALGIFLCFILLEYYVPFYFAYVVFRLLGVAAIAAGIAVLVTARKAPAKEKAAPEEAPQVQRPAAGPSPAKLSDGELTERIRQLEAKARGLKYLLYACAAVGILILIAGGTAAGIVVLLCTCIPVALAQGSCQNQLKGFVSDNIVRGALEAVFDGVEYDPSGHIAEHWIRESRMGLPHYDKLQGSDYVKATYKGLNVELSDISLIEETVTTDEEGNEQRSERTVFQGLWLICDFGKELSADMRIWERGPSLFRDKGIQTENAAFNKKFHIESQVAQEAFYILTPHMMEYILQMDARAGGVTRMCFARSGKVQISIDSGRDAFEIGNKEVDAAALRLKFQEQIRYITDIIDQLRLVDTLYKQ